MSHTFEESKEQMNCAAEAEERFLTEVNAIGKQMLTVESKYCTRIRHTISIRSPVPSSSPIIREDIPVTDARVFLLHNVLTPGECSHYIDQTEEIAYRDLKSEFEESYRSNERLLVLSQTLADYLWRRMQPHLHRNDVVRVRPMCFGNGGSWLPQRLNECFKFGKYQKKQHFGSHIDGPWVPRADESSIYTVLIYLNDNFEGGETVFTPPAERAKLDQEIAHTRQSIEADVKNVTISPDTTSSASTSTSGYHIDPSTSKVTILPRQGTALIFTHDSLHAGLPVLAGKKYVLRTEIMFTRRDSNEIPASIRESYRLDPNYQQTVTLYLDSYAKSLKGDVPGFTNSYLAALKLQHEAQFSVSKDTKAIHELNLPLSLYVHLFTFLDLKDLVSALQCSKSFKDIGKDGSLWKQLYHIRFPTQAQIESQIQHQQRLKSQHSTTSMQSTVLERATSASSESQIPTGGESIKPSNDSTKPDFGMIDPAIQDWYTIFKQRILLQNEFSPVIIDFGSFTTKCSLMTPEDTPVLELLNLVSVINGLRDMHCRRGAWQRYYVGLSVSAAEGPRGRARYQAAQHVFVKGAPADISLIPEVAMACMLKLGVWSHKHPMIVAEPPFGWSQQYRSWMTNSLRAILRLPGLCFVNSAILTLMSQGLDSGIVAHIGHDTAWVAGIYQRRMISFYDFTPQLVSPNQQFNSTWSTRKSQTDVVHPDGTLTPQTQVTPDELAIRTADVYNDMLAQMNDQPQQQSNSSSSTTFHQIVLCGGSTISDDFRQKYHTCITTANSTRRHSDIGLIRERMLQQAGVRLSSSGVNVASITPTNYIHDLTIILPSHPTHTVVEGGKILGGLSFFKEYCIRSFEQAHSTVTATGNGSPAPSLFIGIYCQLWSPTLFLATQLLYETIKNHFHRDEELNGEYIANTSSSDNEIERFCADAAKANAEREENQPELKPSLVWRRRRRNAKPRGAQPHHTGSDSETIREVSNTQPSPLPTPAKLKRPLRMDPKFPFRRARRSAYPILPQPLVKWFEQQTALRTLTPNPTVVRQREEKDDGSGGQEFDVADSSSTTANHPFRPSRDMWHPWDSDAMVGGMIGNYLVNDSLVKIRERFGDRKVQATDEGRWEWTIGACQPSKRRPSLSDGDEEEEENYSEAEEMLEEPNKLVRLKQDHFTAVRDSRLATGEFYRQSIVRTIDFNALRDSGVPKSELTHHLRVAQLDGCTSHGHLVCMVELMTLIPDGTEGGHRYISHNLRQRDSSTRYYYDLDGCLHFASRRNGTQFEPIMFVIYDQTTVLELGTLLDFYAHSTSASDALIEVEESGYVHWYLRTRSTVSASLTHSSFATPSSALPSTAPVTPPSLSLSFAASTVVGESGSAPISVERTFFIRTNWANRLKVDEIKKLYRTCLEYQGPHRPAPAPASTSPQRASNDIDR